MNNLLISHACNEKHLINSLFAELDVNIYWYINYLRQKFMTVHPLQHLLLLLHLFSLNTLHIIICCRFNESGTGKLTLEELKKMMEKLGAPQTHLGLKAMIQVIIILNHYKIVFIKWYNVTLHILLKCYFSIHV